MLWLARDTKEHDARPAVAYTGSSKPSLGSLVVTGSSSSSLVATGPESASSSSVAAGSSSRSLVATCPASASSSSAATGSARPPLPPPPSCVALKAAMGPKTFVKWLTELSPERLDETTESIQAFRAAEAEWSKTHGEHDVASKELKATKKRTVLKLNYKRAIGVRCLAWQAAAGKGSVSPHKDFLLTFRDYSGLAPPKKDRVWLARCIVLAKDFDLQMDSLALCHSGGKRKTMARGLTPDKFLTRRRGMCGPGYKCPVVRELLFDWFVDMRASVAVNISPRFVLMKARQMADHALQHMRETGVFTQLPVFDRAWLLRWKRDYGVVFRRPNMRFKCSMAVLVSRLRAMWLNVIRVRRFIWHFTGVDIGSRMYGIDEKPVHLNEGGSKMVRTLELAGAPDVKLKENHAATRERTSIMTMVTSDLAAATQPRFLPIELLVRARSEKRTRSLVLPTNTNVSVRWAEKGSYREEHLLAYLARWLEPWTPERQAAKDYRVLMMDVARSHIGEEVLDFSFARGYVPLFHYGCTTAVGQVNDTDCHDQFQRVYVDFEQDAFARTQMYDPGNISRSLQGLLDDVVATWRSLDHKAGVAGHLRNGLSNALNGDDDKYITRKARELWFAAGMPELRPKAISEVDELVATGLLTPADWRKVVRHPESAGVAPHEGQEFEGELDDGEDPWTGEADEALQLADDKDVDAAVDEAVASVLAVAVPADAKEVVEEAVGGARRLAVFKRLRADSVAARIPAAAMAVRVRIDQLQRGLCTRPAEKAENNLMRLHLEAVRAREVDIVQKKQAESRKKRRNLLMVKKKMAKGKKAGDEKKRLRAKAKAEEARVPKMFTVEDVGPLGAKGDQSRRECLDRLMEGSPRLSVEQRVNWKTLRDTYLKRHTLKYGARGGDVFLREVNEVLAKLKSQHAGPKDSSGMLLRGAPTAFADFYAKMQKLVPPPTVYALL